MIGAFTFNDTPSSEFKLVCRSVKRPLLPEAKVRRTELMLASGAVDFPSIEYNLREVTVRVTYVGTDYYELRSRAREIAKWLVTDTFKKLYFDDEPSVYYLARISSALDLNSFWQSGTIDVVFDCQPFAYAKDEIEIIKTFSATTTTTTFINPGSRHIDFKSPPGSVFKMLINGDLTSVSITMDDNAVTNRRSSLYYREPEATDNQVIIDSVQMEVKTPPPYGSVNKFKFISGDIDSFFRIAPGVNRLRVTDLNGPVQITTTFVPLYY